MRHFWWTAASPLRTSLPIKLAPVALLTAAAAALVLLASRIRDWAVMTDELQYAKLATHIGQTLSPWPTIRGAHASLYSLLYPALLSPLYGALAPDEAFRAAHVLNALLFVSAAVPAYLIGREAGASGAWSGAIAVLSVVIPWNTLTAFVMTESAAYPAFLWAVLAALRAVAKPSPGRDVVAVAAIAVAVLARTQFVALGLAFVVAAVIYERRGHVVLLVASVGAVGVAAVGGSRVLGNYSVTTHRWPLPLKAFVYAGAHIDEVGIAVGLLPLLIGGAWLVVSARRDPFALLALVTIVVLTLETSSYDVRFGDSIVRDRYLFYVAPLLFVAMARAVSTRQIPRITLLLVAWFVALTGFVYGYPRVPGFWQDSPAGVLHGLIQDLRGPAFVAGVATVLTICVLQLTSRTRALAVTSVALVFVTAVATSGVAWSRILSGRGPSGRELTEAPEGLGWIDSALPGGASVAIVPYASSGRWFRNAARWWDAEFWNADVDASYTVGPGWDYTPFSSRDLVFDPHTGVAAGTSRASPYVVSDPADARLQLAGRRVAAGDGLVLTHVDRPYRALWKSSGLDADGWTRPGRKAHVRVFQGASAAVVLRDVHGNVARRCGSGTIALPARRTGVIGATPLAPSTRGSRAVGVRVLRVRLIRSCLHSSG